MPQFSLLGLVTTHLFLALVLLIHLLTDPLISLSGWIGQCHRSPEPVRQQVNQISKGLLCSGIAASGYTGEFWKPGHVCVVQQCLLQVLEELPWTPWNSGYATLERIGSVFLLRSCTVWYWEHFSWNKLFTFLLLPHYVEHRYLPLSDFRLLFYHLTA